ncbi:MAG: SDR family oxidoreductase [Nitrospinae bacterium]|nr:SDR family oxidoreductase [Nitrospinota bacterium]
MSTAIVTGGAVRIARALACHLAGRGYNIALHYRSSRQAAEETLSEIRVKGVQCHGYACDFKDLRESEGFIARVVADFPDVDLLVNSAANFILENVEKTSFETLTDTLHVNLMTPFLLMRDYKRLVNRGMIVNIVDQRILKNLPAFAAYSVSKAGLAHLTQLAAVEWGATVRVNAIAPGLILPPPWGTEEYLKKEAPKIPTRRHGSPQDIARGLDYLIDSPFVNGEILFIDGGESKASAGTAF